MMPSIENETLIYLCEKLTNADWKESDTEENVALKIGLWIICQVMPLSVYLRQTKARQRWKQTNFKTNYGLCLLKFYDAYAKKSQKKLDIPIKQGWMNTAEPILHKEIPNQIPADSCRSKPVWVYTLVIILGSTSSK